MNFDFLKTTTLVKDHPFKYSICTLVSKKEEYLLMIDSFIKAGFTEDICEFIYVDNTDKNNIDAYQGLNLFLRDALGKYIIICHQDILANHDVIFTLDKRLQELDILDKNWALCGNAGAAGANHIVYNITYPEKGYQSKGVFPLRVSSLDENFIVVKNSAGLSLSNDLKGFHLYATDLCLHAELRGNTAYVIKFNITHKSQGNINKNFHEIRKILINKYSRFFRSRWIQTNSTVFYLSGSRLKWLYGNSISLFTVRMINGLKKRLK